MRIISNSTPKVTGGVLYGRTLSRSSGSIDGKRQEPTKQRDNQRKENGRIPIALDRSAYNQGKNAQYEIGVDESGTAFTVVAKGPGLVAE